MAQLPGEARVNQYTATASQTVFTYTFEVYADDEILVQSGDDTLTLTTDYTVQDAGEEAGGTITLVVGATVDTVITLTGNSMIERDTVFTDGGDYLASAINGEYDKLDNLVKEIVTDQGQNFRLSVYSDTVSTTIPNPTSRKALVWNSAGTALENSTDDPDEQSALAKAQVVLCEAETAKCEAETVLCEAETVKCSDFSTSAGTYADNASTSADEAAASAVDAAASAASIDLDALASDIIPDADGTRDLGSTGTRFAEAYVDDVVITDSLTVNGNAITGTQPVAQYRHEETSGTYGGSIAATTWTTRPINSESFDEIGITLSSNVLTLPAGDYHVNGNFQTAGGNGHAMRLVQDDDDTVIDQCTLGYSPGGHYASYITDFYFTLASETDVRFDQYNTSAITNTAFGYLCSTTLNECYCVVTVTKRG